LKQFFYLVSTMMESKPSAHGKDYVCQPVSLPIIGGLPHDFFLRNKIFAWPVCDHIVAMSLFCFGLSHVSAPLALLERVSFSPAAMATFLKRWHNQANTSGVLGISTCNRTEFYASTSNSPSAFAALLELLRETKGIDLREHSAETFYHDKTDATRHLFKLACGLESLVVGENEIMGQIRKAREAVSDAGIIDDALDSITLRALDVGRRARQSTAISRGNVSVASVGANLATRHLGELSEKCGVILGAGETAEAAARQLADRGMTNLVIANRTYARAKDLAHLMGVREAAMEEVESAIIEADLVVCAIGAPHYVVSENLVKSTLARRPGRPMVLLDLSVPRNIDPAAGNVPGAHLFSMEDMTALAEENRRQRHASVALVKEIINIEIEQMARPARRQETSRFVANLHRRVESLRQDHLARHGHHFDDYHRQHLDTFTSGLTRSLLHELVSNLNSIDLETDEGRQRFQLLQEMFNVGADDGGD